MKKYRFATIGTNFIVRRFLNAAALCNNFELGAVYSRSLETGRQFAGDAANISIYDDLDDLAADSSIDAVYIASPTAFHKEQTIAMLASGKHVLCEKPAASTQQEWLEMLDAAAKHNVVLLEAMRPLHSPGLAIIQDHLKELGTLRSASLTYCQYSSRYDKFKNGIIENAFRPELSNGALMDIGIYCLENMLYLLGMPNRIHSEAYILPDSIDGLGTAIAVYDGMHCILQYSKISDSSAKCEIQGEKGILTYENVGAPTNIKIKYRSGEEKILFENLTEHDMRYELEAFICMMDGKASADSFQTISRQAFELSDSIRHQNGIHFTADSK